MSWSLPPNGRPKSPSCRDPRVSNGQRARRSRYWRSLPRWRLERVAGVDRRRARTRCLLEQSASLLGLGRIGKGSGDQPPLLVGREHAARLKPGDEGAMIGEELAPERAQRILLGDGADLDAVARRAVIGGGRQG